MCCLQWALKHVYEFYLKNKLYWYETSTRGMSCDSFLSVLQLHLPLNSPLAGSELTKEPFRWDQRLFALVLRLPGAAAPDNEQLGSVPTDESAITQMCEVTGGSSRCFAPLISCSKRKGFSVVSDFSRTVVLCSNAEDVKSVSGVSGSEGSEWGRPAF